MKKFYSLSICLALFFSVLIVANLEAATYYIDGSNGIDSSSGALASPWKTISKANSTLKAGDTVFLRVGTYSSQQIEPTNSGTSGNYITYQNYNGESVTIGGSEYGACLDNKDYIKVDGFSFVNTESSWIYLTNAASYNIIQNCTFYDSGAWGGIKLDIGENYYNQILNNVFLNAPNNPTPSDTMPGDIIYIEQGSYTIIEGNTFGKCSHGAISILDDYGKATYNVVRNNNFNNEYHTGIIINSANSYHATTLVENNRFYDQGEDYLNNPNSDGARYEQPGVQIIGEDCIVRYNIFDNNGWGIYFGAYNSYGADRVCNDSRFYNNTLYHNYHQVAHSGDSELDYNGNILKNNIVYLAREREWCNWADLSNTENYFINNAFTPNASSFYFKNTWQTARTLAQCQNLYPVEWDSSNFSANPLFTDASNRIFTLQQSSPMIDAGGWLTTITSNTANNQTSFVVADPKYFYDGWGIPGEEGDMIKTAGGKVTTITDINYSAHTITVSPAIDIVNGEGLSLNYSGSAPDIGACEYGSAVVVAPPTRVRLLLGN